MEESIILNGKVSQIQNQLKLYGISLNEAETRILLDTILENKQFLQSDECASSQIVYPNLPSGCLGMMILDYKYHISIKKLSLCVLAFIADKLTWGISSAILNALGMSDSLKSVNRIDEENGEKCIVKETALYHKRIGDEYILDSFDGMCRNNNLNCKFRNNDRCECSREDIKEIYDNLVEKGVFEKTDVGYELMW